MYITIFWKVKELLPINWDYISIYILENLDIRKIGYYKAYNSRVIHK
jgi:hypothetical protein